MSIIPPPESGMQFGPFQESRFIPWEKSNLRNACGDGFKCVEYICLDNLLMMQREGLIQI